MNKIYYDPKARLYLELHITLESKADEDFPKFQELAKQYDWRASRFSEDDVDDYNGKWFMSSREDYKSVAIKNLENMIIVLETAGFTILRWKIEDTLLDSKYGDKL